MASGRKYPDRAVAGKLKKYSEVPPPDVWEAVSDHLSRKGRKARMFVVTRLAAAGAAVLIAAAAWLLLHDRTVHPDGITDRGMEAGTVQEQGSSAPNSENEADRPVVSERTSTPGKEGEQRGTDSVSESPEQSAVIPDSNEDLIAREEKPASGPAAAGRGDAGPAGENRTAWLSRRLEGRTLAAIRTGHAGGAGVNGLKKAGSAVAEADVEKEGIVVIGDGADNRTAAGRWVVGPRISPVYSYRDLGSMGGSLSPQSTDRSLYSQESGLLAYSGGIDLGYRYNDRLSLQSGLFYSKMGLEIDHSYLYPYASLARFVTSSLKYNSIGNSSGTIVQGDPSGEGDAAFGIVISDPNTESNIGTPDYYQSAFEIRDADFRQYFEYLEVPLTLKYRLTDRRVDFSMIGGLATGFLIGNDVILIEDGNKQQIGYTRDIRKIRYSSVAGLGMETGLSQRFRLNLEPFFKYSLNSINKSSGVESRPFSFGIYTGVSYRF